MNVINERIEKLVFKLDINEYISVYNYETQVLSVGGNDEVKSESDYLLIRNNTIAKMLQKKAIITMTINNEVVDLPKIEVENVANYRPQARIKGSGKFNGIQGHDNNGNLGLGGNIMHHIIFWDVTKDEAEKRLQKLIDSFGDKYEFKIVKA